MNPSSRTIAIIAPYFPPYGGGLERYAREVARHLQKNYAWRVIVITSGAWGGKDIKETLDGLTIYHLGYRFKFSNTPFSFTWFKKIRAILKNERPDIMNIHMPVPGIGDVASMVKGNRPLVVTYHASSMRKGRIAPDIFIWLYEHGPLRLLLRRADRIVCSSDFVRTEFLRKYLYKSITIPPAVDTEAFKPGDGRKAEHPTVLFVAGLSRSEQHKGLMTLLRAIRLIKETVPKVTLAVVGDGNMRSEYAAYAKYLGLQENVVFKGRLVGGALTEAYQQSHVFAAPSTNEGFGMAILEAMACGLPVVASNIGGIPSLIAEGKTGFLVPPGDPEALAQKLSELLLKPAIADAFGKTAWAKTKEAFDWHRSAARYNHLFIQTLGKNVPHTPRLTVVASYFYPKIGGLETIAYRLARDLHKSGKYQVSVITSNYEAKGYRQDIIDGMVVHRLPIWFRVSNTPINPFWYWWIKRIFKVEHPDLVHTHSPVPYLADLAVEAASNEHIPVLATYHSGSMRKGRWPVDIIISFYERIFLRRLFKRSNAVVAVSQTFARNYFPQFAEKTFFIPTGVDLSRFKKTPLPKEDTVTFIGRIEHSSSWKGIEQLLQAMAIVIKHRPHARLELVGGGDAIDHYRARAEALGIGASVSLPGSQSGEKLIDAYRRATIVVLPSTSDSEAFSVALVEAMACGRPVIGTNIGGTPQVIDNEKDGFLVPPKDPQALAAAIERILGDRALAEKLGNAGAEKSQLFSWELQNEKYRALYEKIQ